MAKGFMDQSIGQSEKSGLVNDIIGGGKGGSKGTAPGTDHTGSKLPGKWDGNLHIKRADNGIVINHTRHIPRAVKKGHIPGEPGGMSSPGSDYKDHSHIVAHGDRNGLLNHLHDIGIFDKDNDGE